MVKVEQSLTQLAASQTEQQARTPHLLEQQFTLLGKSVDTVREGVGRHEERMREILAKLDNMVPNRQILTMMARKFILTGLNFEPAGLQGGEPAPGGSAAGAGAEEDGGVERRGGGAGGARGEAVLQDLKLCIMTLSGAAEFSGALHGPAAGLECGRAGPAVRHPRPARQAGHLRQAPVRAGRAGAGTDCISNSAKGGFTSNEVKYFYQILGLEQR